MKRALILVLLISVAFGAFADEARVLPKGVFRTYILPNYIFASEAFDADGEKGPIASKGEYTVFNLGGAFEYGITDWASIAIQFAPGMNLYTDFEDSPKMSANLPFELFAGGKIQFIGPKAPVASETFRVALAPGLVIPMTMNYDATAEAIAAGGGQDFTTDPSNGVYGFGTRFYADYVFNENFYLNLYSEFIKYFQKDAEDDFVATLGGLGAGDTVDYGFKSTSELDLNFSKPLNEGFILMGNLPLIFEYQPEVSYNEADVDSANASYVMSIRPTAAFMVTSFLFPIEFELSYQMPLLGQNADARNIISAQIKGYLKF